MEKQKTVKAKREITRDKISFWRAHIRAQRKSGLSIAEYCRRQGLSRHRFFYWRKRISQKVKSGDLVSVVKVGEVRRDGIIEFGYDFRVKTRGGNVIEVKRGFSRDDLSKVIRVVEGI